MPEVDYLDEDIAVISRSGLFDASWYLEHSKDVCDANVDPIRHYVLHGEKEGRQPSKELRLDLYINEVSPEVIGDRSPLAHYIITQDPAAQYRIISRSGLFDQAWYLETYADLQHLGMDPIKHYIFYGAKEGRQPNPEFRPEAESASKALAVPGPQNPLIQFILSGSLESKAAIIEKSGLFDPDWYLKKNPDVGASDIDPVEHYILYGEKEGRQPNKKLNLKRYIVNVTSAKIGAQSPLVHYILYGEDEDLIDAGKLSTLSRKTIGRAIERLERLPLYTDDDYLELNSDVKNSEDSFTVAAANHALAYGVPEGRHVFKPLRVAYALGEAARRPFPAPPAAGAVPSIPPVAIFYNSSGNVFLKELAQELVDALRLIGVETNLLDDTADPKELLPISIIMAPHEFFHIGDGRKWVQEDVISNVFMYNTEQPQTLWFERALPFILASRGVIDICYQMADIFSRTGMPVMHFNPNAVMQVDWLSAEDREHQFYKILPNQAKQRPDPAVPFEKRPIDVAFFGSASRHRDVFFAKNAKFLAAYNNFIYYRKFTGPLTASSRDGVLSRIGQHVTGHSKISLNIHRDELGFFEWHRLVKLGMLGGSIVVTEPCLPHPVFKPDVHYLEETTRHMPDLIEWLVKSKDGQAKAKMIKKNIANITDIKTARMNSSSLANFLAGGSL